MQLHAGNVGVKQFQIMQHRNSPACREARLWLLSQNYMATNVQAVLPVLMANRQQSTVDDLMIDDLTVDGWCLWVFYAEMAAFT